MRARSLPLAPTPPRCPAEARRRPPSARVELAFRLGGVSRRETRARAPTACTTAQRGGAPSQCPTRGASTVLARPPRRLARKSCRNSTGRPPRRRHPATRQHLRRLHRWRALYSGIPTEGEANLVAVQTRRHHACGAAVRQRVCLSYATRTPSVSPPPRAIPQACSLALALNAAPGMGALHAALERAACRPSPPAWLTDPSAEWRRLLDVAFEHSVRAGLARACPLVATQLWRTCVLVGGSGCLAPALAA